MDLVKYMAGINPWGLFRFMLCFYLLCMAIGFILGKAGMLDIKKVTAWRKYPDHVYSPLLPLRDYYRRIRNGVLLEKRFRLLAVMIFLNNFILAMAYGKVLTGIIPFLPLVMLFLTGIGQGTIFAKQPAAALSPLLFLEFGGYVFGSTMGMALSVSIAQTIIMQGQPHFGLFIASLKLLLPWAIAFLAAGAIVESLILRMAPVPAGATEEDLKRWMETFRQKNSGK